MVSQEPLSILMVNREFRIENRADDAREGMQRETGGVSLAKVA